ncbi:MAG TPA: roadblock/LC7 domain-containing protein [Gemmatimonadales bacterium]|nr:roadblock/LC7 domain-containing protein [Gemmatimonadales bacterium]
MPGLRDVVQGLSRREGVRAVVVVSDDGLPIDSAARDGFDPDAVAALVPPIARQAARLGGVAGCGDVVTGVLEFQGGFAVLAPLGRDHHLVLVVAPETNLGALLYDLRRHRPAVARLL